jgi:hypothetical protein
VVDAPTQEATFPAQTKGKELIVAGFVIDLLKTPGKVWI